MKTYELTYIVSPELISEEAEAKSKEIETIIQNKEGSILKQLNPIAKTLSYPIKKQASGYLGVLEFQLEPERLNELEENLKKDEKIVRHMVIIKKPAKQRKERRTRIKTGPSGYPILETKAPTEELSQSVLHAQEENDPKGTPKKVELKEIEQKLDEILGE